MSAAQSPIERAALRWIEARIERDQLKERRGSCVCEHESPWLDEPREAGGEPNLKSGRACWKGEHVMVGPEDQTIWEYERHPDQWCASCRHRAELHAQLLKARRSVGALHAALTRAARAALQQKAQVPS